MVLPRKRKVDSYDGQVIKVSGEPAYELGNYLGGGVAGVVYEATSLKAASHEAPQRAVVLGDLRGRLRSQGAQVRQLCPFLAPRAALRVELVPQRVALESEGGGPNAKHVGLSPLALALVSLTKLRGTICMNWLVLKQETN